jgi:hypothetical protein
MLAVVGPITAALNIAAEGADPKDTGRLITDTVTALGIPPIAAVDST